MEADEPVTVYTVNNPCEAEVIKTALQGQGISCQLDGEGQAGLSDILEIVILVPATHSLTNEEPNHVREELHCCYF